MPPEPTKSKNLIHPNLHIDWSNKNIDYWNLTERYRKIDAFFIETGF